MHSQHPFPVSGHIHTHRPRPGPTLTPPAPVAGGDLTKGGPGRGPDHQRGVQVRQAGQVRGRKGRAQGTGSRVGPQGHAGQLGNPWDQP